MLETIWAVTSTALLVFCVPRAYRKGYLNGADHVLDAWKNHIQNDGGKEV